MAGITVEFTKPSAVIESPGLTVTINDKYGDYVIMGDYYIDQVWLSVKISRITVEFTKPPTCHRESRVDSCH